MCQIYYDDGGRPSEWLWEFLPQMAWGRQNTENRVSVSIGITMQYYAKYLGSHDDGRLCLDSSLSGK